MALEDELIFIAKATVSEIGLLQRGAAIVAAHSTTIDELRYGATRDRLWLAERMLNAAQVANAATPAEVRSTVSRAYYSLYHTFRAVVFFVSRGDDHQEHNKLPTKIPDDYPDADAWRNRLKSARLERNRADYDAYPKMDSAFAAAAQQTLQDATAALPVARAYLVGKGLK